MTKDEFLKAMYSDPYVWIRFVGTDEDCIVLTKGRDYQEENDGESNRVRGLFYSP
jgi:hypothetical protein